MKSPRLYAARLQAAVPSACSSSVLHFAHPVVTRKGLSHLNMYFEIQRSSCNLELARYLEVCGIVNKIQPF